MIEMDPADLEEARKILAFWAPDIKVLAYGSRTNGKARRTSDLDLTLQGEDRIPNRVMSRLKDAFSLSDIPYMVDIPDLKDCPDWLKKIVLETGVDFFSDNQARSGTGNHPDTMVP